MAVDLAMHPIRNSIDLGWSGVSTKEISNSLGCEMDAHAARRSMQYDPEISMQLSCPQDSFSKGEQLLPSEASELLQLLQGQQQQQQLQLALAQLDTQSDGETEIDAQIQQLLQLKQFLRRSKQAVTQQQQQQVILEGVALADAANGLDASASGLFASSGLATPAMQSER
jgi:hypothetical protein